MPAPPHSLHVLLRHCAGRCPPSRTTCIGTSRAGAGRHLAVSCALPPASLLSVAIFFWQSGICVGQMPHGALALAGEGASPCAGPFSDARPSTPLTAAQNRHIVQLETLLAKERSEHAVLKHRHAACEHELSDLRMSLYGRRESDETLESLQSHIKELQIMIWQVRRAPDYLTTDWCMLMNIAEMDAYV